MIRQQKQKFRNIRSGRTQAKIKSETEKLEAEKIRLGKTAKLRAKEQAARRDVQAIRDYNAKVVAAKGPTKAQRFAKGLQKTINKTREHKGKSGGIQFGGSGFGGGMNKEPSFGGSSGSSPFGGSTFGNKPKPKEKKKQITIRITQ